MIFLCFFFFVHSRIILNPSNGLFNTEENNEGNLIQYVQLNNESHNIKLHYEYVDYYIFCP